MYNPVDVSPFLEPCGVFRIHVGSPAISGTTASEGGVERFKMIGMNIFGLNNLVCLRVLGARGLIFRPFGPSLMPLRPFILQPHFDTFR